MIQFYSKILFSWLDKAFRYTSATRSVTAENNERALKPRPTANIKQFKILEFEQEQDKAHRLVDAT